MFDDHISWPTKWEIYSNVKSSHTWKQGQMHCEQESSKQPAHSSLPPAFVNRIITHVMRASSALLYLPLLLLFLPLIVLLSKRSQGKGFNASEAEVKKQSPLPTVSKEYKNTAKAEPLKWTTMMWPTEETDLPGTPYRVPFCLQGQQGSPSLWCSLSSVQAAR